MTNEADGSGSISDTDIRQILKRLALNDGGAESAEKAQKVVNELLDSTDKDVKELIAQQSQRGSEEASDVESLLRLTSDDTEVQSRLLIFQRQLIEKLASVVGNREAAVEYTDEQIDAFVKGTMSSDDRSRFVKQLRTDTDVRKRCILWRENLSELDVPISPQAADAFNDGSSQLWSGNRNFPGHEWNSYGKRANEFIFVRAREASYNAAKKSFEKLLELGELEDLALANLAIVETNMRNAPIAARFYPAEGYDHGDAMVRAVNEGKQTPQEAVFGQVPIPSDSSGNVPPSWREGIPLRMQPDDRPVEELLTLDISNPNCARQLIRRLHEYVPQERYRISFDSLQPFRHEEELTKLMEQAEFVEALIRFMEEPLPGGNDNQLSNLNDSRKVAYRLLAMRFVQTGDTELLPRIKDLFSKGLESFRNRGGGDWETNWFHEGPEIIIHYADESDDLWAIISEVIEEASKTGMKEYFVNSLHLFSFTESMAKLDHRFSTDASARQFIENLLINSGDQKVAGDGMRVLQAFPDTERVRVCLRCLDGTYKQDNFGRNLAIRHLQKIDGGQLQNIEPEITTKLSLLLEKELVQETDEKFQKKPLDTENLIELSLLVHSTHQAEGVQLMQRVLDHFIETGKRGINRELSSFAQYCRENSIDSLRTRLIDLYPSNISEEYLVELRQWGVGDDDLAPAFLSAAAEDQKKYTGYFKGSTMDDVYDQIILSLEDKEEETEFRDEERQGIHTGKDPLAWTDLVERGADEGSIRFIELLLQEQYRHLLSPERIQHILDAYVQRTMKETSEWEVHDDSTTNRYHEILAACAHIPETRQYLLASVEQEIQKFDTPETIAANNKNSRLLYFLMQLHEKIIAVETNEKSGDLSPQVRSWLFFSREFQPPAEVSQLVFDYCLNDNTRESVNVTSSFDDFDQMEAVRYVHTVFNLVGKRDDEDETEEAPISLQALETYVNNVVVGRKIPVAALQAAYAFRLPHIAWNKAEGGGRSGRSAQEILQLMKYPILGVTSGGMNHRGPAMQGLSARLNELYSHIRYKLSSLEFGQEEGQDADLETTFFLSAMFRLRKYQAVEVLRSNRITDTSLYKKVARFASMGATEAEEDQDYEVTLEMLQVLQEIVDVVPEDAMLEGMRRKDFQSLVSHKIEQISAKVDTIKSERIEEKG